MTREYIDSDQVFRARGAMSHAVKAGGFVFVSAITPYKIDRSVALDDFPAQMHQTMGNLKAVLAAAGTSLERVVKMNVVLRRAGDLPVMDQIYRSYFPEGRFPARVTVEGTPVHADMLVQLDCVAETQ